MRAWRGLIAASGLVLALSGTVSAQSPSPPVDLFAGRMPEEIAGERMFRASGVTEAGFRDYLIFLLGDAVAYVETFGIDLGSMPFATSVNLDYEGLMDEIAAGTATRDDYETWLTNDALMVIALRTGPVPIDELMDAIVATFETPPLDDFMIEGRRVTFVTAPPEDASIEGWSAMVGVDGMLYLMLSTDVQPSLLQTVAAIPVPDA
jgi:hypothetical protein